MAKMIYKIYIYKFTLKKNRKIIHCVLTANNVHTIATVRAVATESVTSGCPGFASRKDRGGGGLSAILVRSFVLVVEWCCMWEAVVEYD